MDTLQQVVMCVHHLHEHCEKILQVLVVIDTPVC